MRKLGTVKVQEKSRVHALRSALADGILPQHRGRILEQEIESLSPYFNSLAQTSYSDRVMKPEEIKYNADQLRHLFKLQSIRTGSLITSSFRILSLQELKEFSSAPYTTFSQTSFIASHELLIGFIQSLSMLGYGDKLNCTIPVIGIGPTMMERIEDFAPDHLYALLEKLFTFANHDYLHHYTSDGINDNVAQSRPNKSEVRERFMKQFGQAEDNPKSYESFMIESHASSFRHAFSNDEHFKNDYLQTISSYLDELEKIGQSMDLFIQSKNDKYKIRETLNYFGRAALFSMVRLFRTDDPVFVETAKALSSLMPDLPREIVLKRNFQKHIDEVQNISRHLKYLMPKIIPGDEATIERRETLEKLMIDCIENDITSTSRNLQDILPKFEKLCSDHQLCAIQVENLAENLRLEIEKAHYDPSYLGLPEGLHGEEINQIIDEAAHYAHRSCARQKFDQLNNTKTKKDRDNARVLADGIYTHLRETGDDLSILDETGRSSSAEIKALITSKMPRQRLPNYFQLPCLN